MVTKTSFLFPGQGSQYIGMGLELANAYPVALRTFQESDRILETELSRLAWEGPVDQLNDTYNTQPALLTHSVAVLRVLKEIKPQLIPTYVAGHSLGEYSANVASEVLSFEDALKLVRKRGELMKKAGQQSPGGLAAILGLTIDQVEEVCTEASTPSQPVQVANDNCPGQVVISGTSNALEIAINLASLAGARRVVKLDVSIAAHSSLMQPIKDDFKYFVDNMSLKTPKIPIIGNVTALPLNNIQAVADGYGLQLTSRVRWVESVNFLLDEGVEQFYEIGSGKVLTGLMKRIKRSASCLPTDNPANLAKLLN